MKITGIILFCVILGLWGVNAQTSSDSELLKKLVEKNILTQEEADEIQGEPIKTKPAFVGNLGKIREAFNTPYLKFGGYGLFWYQYKDHQPIHHDMGIRAIFLSMSGNLTEHLRYFILAEFSDPTVHEFYGEWMPADAFKLRGGQFKIPLGFENQLSLTTLETVSNTRSVSSLIGMAGDPIQYSNSKWKNKGGRDIGVQASGALFKQDDYHLLHYAAGVFQGTGINVSENNSTKDFTGTLIFQPFKEFRFGGGVYAGKASIYNQRGIYQGDDVRNRWMVNTDYNSDRVYARAEWIRANDGGTRKEGLHGTALYYLLPRKLNIVGKVDYFNQNKDTNSEVIDYIAGINYYFYDQCRFQLNYTYSDYSKKWGGTHLSDNLVQLQMQVVF